MVSVTAALLIKILNLPADFDDETMENIIDQAIDLINLYGNAEVPNMGGTAGSKTLNLTSQEKGAVVTVARVIFKSFYKNASDAVAIGGISIGSSDMMGNPTVMSTIRGVSKALYKAKNEMEVGTG